MKKPFIALLILPLFLLCAIGCNNTKTAATSTKEKTKTDSIKPVQETPAAPIAIDTADYNKRMLALSNGDTTGRWPVKAPYPLPGAILHYHRIIAFYGN